MTLQRRIVVLLLVLAGLCLLPNRPARADFGPLLAKLPAGANTIVMVNAQQMFASEVATQGGWKQKFDAAYSDAPLLIPPEAQQFVLAADLDLATMNARQQVAVLKMGNDPSMNMVARTVRGTRDMIGNVETVSTPRGATIIKFAPQLFGLMQPGGRQAGARWIRDIGTNVPARLSPYLASIANVPDQVGTEIIMAIDMTDALSRDRIRQALGRSDVLAKANIDLDRAADVLSGLRGAKLGIRVTRRVYGVLSVEFDRDVAPLAAVAKPLLLEVLSEAGASISEFSDWQVKVTQREIALDGELTGSGLRRLFSFLDVDGTAVAAAEAGPNDAKTPDAGAAPLDYTGQPDPQTSLKYFQSIQRCLGDLSNERGATSYASIALWFDKYAKRIDKLPILGVDKDLIDYGQFVVYNLRNAVDAIRGVGIRSGAQTASVSGGGYSDYYVFDSAVNYAYNVSASPMNAAKADISAAESQRRAIRATERAQGTTDARAVMRQITDKTSEVKRQMTERYKIEFGATAAKQ